MTFLVRMLLLGGATLLAACSDAVDCQSSPQPVQVFLTDAAGSPLITAAMAANVGIGYYHNGQWVSLPDARVNPATTAVSSYDALTISRETGDTTRFWLGNGASRLGVIQLKTYVDNSPCNGWTRASELRFNGRVVPFEAMKPGYTLVVAP
ncbi:hypothetical protein GGR92_002512 [Spirosoma lacussanchae]|uniref:hypothetical protein n=1 Tax=Spirosoma lacussanchae TaxID=1884249 RepID=UPI001108CD30|nr:hypothetical protein [Spirosoma lacussanchae]